MGRAVPGSAAIASAGGVAQGAAPLAAAIQVGSSANAATTPAMPRASTTQGALNAAVDTEAWPHLRVLTPEPRGVERQQMRWRQASPPGHPGAAYAPPDATGLNTRKQRRREDGPADGTLPARKRAAQGSAPPPTAHNLTAFAGTSTPHRLAAFSQAQPGEQAGNTHLGHQAEGQDRLPHSEQQVVHPVPDPPTDGSMHEFDDWLAEEFLSGSEGFEEQLSPRSQVAWRLL